MKFWWTITYSNTNDHLDKAQASATVAFPCTCFKF